MKRLLVFCAALAMVSGCKKDEETQNPDDATETPAETGDEESSEPAEPEVPQEPDPPEIAAARLQVLATDFAPAAATLEPLVKDLTDRQQFRASGLAAAWYALSLVSDIAENAKEPAEYAVSMADKTQDPEVIAAAYTALGAYQLGIESFEEAAKSLKKAYDADQQGPEAALAMIVSSEVRIAMAFGGTDQITKPEELDVAETALSKAKELATAQGSDILLGRALVNEAAIARYRRDQKKACKLLAEGMEKYEAASAAEYLTSGAQALKDAAFCK